MADGTAITTLPGSVALETRPDAVFSASGDYLALGLAYALLVAFTVPFFMGDTIGYADAILDRLKFIYRFALGLAAQRRF